VPLRMPELNESGAELKQGAVARLATDMCEQVGCPPTTCRSVGKRAESVDAVHHDSSGIGSNTARNFSSSSGCSEKNSSNSHSSWVARHSHSSARPRSAARL